MLGRLQARLEVSFVLVLMLLLDSTREVRGCAPTQGAITPSVTPTLGTTTTTTLMTTMTMTTSAMPSTSTTTSTPTSCTACMTSSINFVTIGEGATDFSPPMGMLSMNAAGCNQLLLVCLPGADGASTIDNGDDSNIVTYCNNFGTCVETLTCNAMGEWTLTQSGMTTVITEIRCEAT